MKIGDRVTVKPGATEWLKSHGHWADYMPDSIDRMTGTIDADYRDLPGDKAHLCVELGFAHHVGISEHLLDVLPYVFLDGSRLKTTDVAHRKVRFAGHTYFVGRYPEGDYAIHEAHATDHHGYGESNVAFLLEDGTYEIVKGPYSKGGLFDHGIADELSKHIGVPSIAVKATKLTVSAYSGGPKRVVFEETDWQLGDWRTRVRTEWHGCEVAIQMRCGTAFERL